MSWRKVPLRDERYVFSLMHIFSSFAGLQGGLALFNACFRAVLRSPESFFDTTPLGTLSSYPPSVYLLIHRIRTNPGAPF